MAKLDERRIVSSRHLAEGEGWETSELEFGMIVAYNSFSRWMTRCMTAAGHADLTPLDILVVHHVNHRSRGKRLSDICFLLNIEDSHTVNYSLKKLLKSGLVRSEKIDKEVYYSTSEEGQNVCERYRKIRSQCLISGIKKLDFAGQELRESAALLRSISGQYDQASRAASSL